jgi:REP element-mobilizing transposase RayT
MPRHPRLFIPGATYHVYCRVARGEFVFEDDFEAVEFIDALRNVRDLDRWTVYAWCLMGNHYHLVLKTFDVDLWRSMARLQGRVARGFNRRHRYLGRLWQSRYRARVIDSIEYFRQVVAYVHLNPVAAGVVEDPARFPYSGHREIIGACRPHVVDLHAVLREFGIVDSSDTVADYLNWVRSVAEAKWPDGDVSTLPWWSQANHVDEIADADRHPDATTFDGQRLAEERAVFDIDEFANRFQMASEYAIEDLASHLRSGAQIQGRIVFTTLAANRYRIRGRAIAALLAKHHNSVTKWLAEGLRRESTDPEFKRLLDTLDAEISSRD